jgi:hypothetical protein
MKHYRDLKSSLKENEVLLHIDLAENYLSKMSKEIQIMHFGASKSQITLHTILHSPLNLIWDLCNVSFDMKCWRYDACT